MSRLAFSDQVRAQAESARTERFAELRELLARSDSPRDGDVSRAAALVNELGLSVGDLPGLIHASTKQAEAGQTIKEFDEFSDSPKQLLGAIAEVEKWKDQETQRISREADEKMGPAKASLARYRHLDSAARDARNLDSRVEHLWTLVAAGRLTEAREVMTHL